MHFRFYDKPGLHLPAPSLARLRTTLHALASKALHPVPNYQCLAADDPTALDDKLLVIAYAGRPAADQPSRAIAFSSTFLLPGPVPGVDHPVLHTGLTVVDPAHRRRGVVMALFAQLAAHVVPRYGRDGLWVTCLAEVPSSLGHVTQYLEDVYPSPPGVGGAAGEAREEHRAIARAIAGRWRREMLISPAAVFDEGRFVFRGSNDWPEGECFKKDPRDERWRHRDEGWNRFFEERLSAGSGDEVLQVGWCSAERAAMIVEMLARRTGEVGARL